jgi:protein O-GlcNAc transferase
MTTTADLPYDQAIVLHRAGDLAGAELGYRAELAANPDEPRATQMLGVLAFQTGRAPLAVQLLRRAAELAPASPECHGNLGLVLAASGQPADAVIAYRRAIELKPDFGEAHVNLGNALREAGDPAAAAEAYRRGTLACPDLSAAHYNLGLLLADAGRLAEATTALRRACHLRPDGGEEHAALARALFLGGDLAAAATAFARVAELLPDSADAWNNLGTALDRLGRPAEAAAAFGHAVRLQPDGADGHFNLAAALRHQGRHGEAIGAVRRALALRPAWPEAWNNLGVWLLETNRLPDAAEAFARAIALRPDHAEAHCNLGSVLRQFGRPADAIAFYRRAVALRPDYAVAMSNLGAALERSGEVDEAIATLRRAISLRPDLSEAHNNLGNALKEAGDLDGALAAFARAVGANPDNAEADSNRVYTLLYHADADARSHRDAAVAWGRRHAAPLGVGDAPHANDRAPGRRLRVGYVAPDFRDHCQSFFTLPLLSNHDRSQVEVVCYADVATPDAVTRRLRGHADVWRDTAGLTDAALADRVRGDGIDVLVDLTVHMSQHRLLAFARRPAPVQVSWLGYPGTTGVEAIDYRLSDPFLDPPGDDREALYAERTIRLPDTFWCYDPLTDGPPVGPLPAARNGFVTFGCLNNFCKVTDTTLRLWARVMGRVPGSRLLLLTPAGSARERVLGVLRDGGVDGGRVEFVGRQPRRAYLDSYHRIDVGLDTFPYNGHTTSLDACWMGVPVVTALGDSAVGRAGWSQLSNLGLRQLVGDGDDGFVAIGAGLAADLDGLAGLRATLRARLESSPLGDGPRFARGVEAAYRQMWEAHCQQPVNRERVAA